MTKEESISKMRQAIDAYKKDKNSAKQFFVCMKEISTWLQSKAK